MNDRLVKVQDKIKESLEEYTSTHTSIGTNYERIKNLSEALAHLGEYIKICRQLNSEDGRY